MPKEHIVSHGESIESIAYRYGLYWETVWNAGENARLRELRREPNILVAGDRVFIPDKRKHAEACRTDARHVFRRRGVPSRLRVQMLDGSEPRAGLAYTLVASGRTRTGLSDSQGWIDCWLMPDVRAGELRIDATGEVYPFEIGGVSPPDTPRGAQTRLRNLGLYGGAIDDRFNDAALSALKLFQRTNRLEETGELDSATVDALRERHGS